MARSAFVYVGVGDCSPCYKYQNVRLCPKRHFNKMFVPGGVSFHCIKKHSRPVELLTKYALTFNMELERMFLMRFYEDEWYFVNDSFKDDSKQSFIIPNILDFRNDVKRAGVWMEERCLEVFNIVNLLTAIVPYVFSID